MFKFAVATALAMKIPITNEVVIKGKGGDPDISLGTGSDLEASMGTCHSESYNPPLSMGIIEKGQTVKVTGAEVKMILHMRGRCEKYGSFDYEVGACKPGTAADGETVSESYTTDHTIQSWELVNCGGAMAARQTLADQETWSDHLPTLPPNSTPDCEAIFNREMPKFTEACGYCRGPKDPDCSCPDGAKIQWYFGVFTDGGECSEYMR